MNPMPGQLDDFEKALDTIWGETSIKPEYVQMPLATFRKHSAEYGLNSQAVTVFLAETKDISGDAIVVMTPGNLSLLVDENNNLLSFA